MKPFNFDKKLTSQQLKENISKLFNVNVNLDKYSREQLEDIRNQIRTKVFQYENQAGFNELLTDETYQKDTAILKLLNTRIKEMLGEDIKKLKDKLVALEEAKKSKKNDDNLANNYPPFDKVTRGDVIAGAKGQDQKGGKKMKEEAVDEAKACTCDHDKKKKHDKNCPVHGDKVSEGRRVSGTYGTAYDPETDSQPSQSTSKGKFDASALAAATGTAKGKSDQTSKGRVVKGSAQSGSTKESVEKCNYTAEGKMCEVHGKKECPMEEATERKAEVKPSKGMTAKEKSAVVKKAKSGADMGKPGKNFEKIAKAAGGGKKGEKIAGSVFWKGEAKKAKAKESLAIFRQNVRIVNESLEQLLQEDEEAKAKIITAAGDMVNDFTSWMQRVGQFQTKSMIELADAIKSDFGPAESEAFKQAIAPALTSTLETLTQQREAISNAVAVLAGEATAPQPMGPEPTGVEEPMPSAEPDQMNEPTADQLAASEPAATGREMRESKFAQRLAESHSIIAKLAK